MRKQEHYGSVSFNRLVSMADGPYIADRNLYLDADGNLVEEDNPAQVRQLIGRGGSLSKADAEKYGLMKSAKPEAEEEGEEKATAPKANKSAKPAKNKGAK